MSSASVAVAVVTGGGRGIGLGIGRCLAAAGYRGALWDSDAGNVEPAAATLCASGAAAIGLTCDIASVDEVNRAAEDTERKLGIPYLLVNNAGTRHRARLEDLSRADWDDEVAINLSGAFQCTQTIGRRM